MRPFEMTVLENIMVPILTHTKNMSQAEKKACEVMELMGISHLSGTLPGQLTLVQRKRIEVAPGARNQCEAPFAGRGAGRP